MSQVGIKSTRNYSKLEKQEKYQKTCTHKMAENKHPYSLKKSTQSKRGLTPRNVILPISTQTNKPSPLQTMQQSSKDYEEEAKKSISDRSRKDEGNLLIKQKKLTEFASQVYCRKCV